MNFNCNLMALKKRVDRDEDTNQVKVKKKRNRYVFSCNIDAVGFIMRRL